MKPTHKERAEDKVLKNPNYRHGMNKTRPHRIWQGMKGRCDRKTTINYKLYVGRGISYDPKWKTFIGFWDDMKEGYADNLSLDRIDNTKGYSKTNCRWATRLEQSLNTSRNRYLTHNGKTQTVIEWERELGFKRGVVRQRMDTYGWSVEKALTKPLRNKHLKVTEPLTK